MTEPSLKEKILQIRGVIKGQMLFIKVHLNHAMKKHAQEKMCA